MYDYIKDNDEDRLRDFCENENVQGIGNIFFKFDSEE